MPYSVSPYRKLKIVGLNPSWNFSTRMPTRLAGRKCPSSCTNTSTPSTNANETRVVSTETSDFQFYPACNLERTLAGLAIDRPHRGERRHLGGAMGFERSLDDLRNRHEAETAV